MDAQEKARLAVEAMEEVKGEEIAMIEVADRTHMTDYMVICSGTSNIHIRAIADRVLERMREHGFKGIRQEGYKQARWILMDFGDVLVHIFDPEDRAFYRLEEFWEREKSAAA